MKTGCRLLLLALITLVYSCSGQDQDAISYHEQNGHWDKAINKGGAVIYKNSDGAKVQVFPKTGVIDVRYLSYEDGELVQRTQKNTAVSSFIDVDYSQIGGRARYRFYYDQKDKLVYLEIADRPLEALVYSVASKRYYVVSFQYDFTEGTFAIPSDRSFNDSVLRSMLTERQLDIYYENEIGKQFQLVKINKKGEVSLQNRIGYLVLDESATIIAFPGIDYSEASDKAFLVEKILYPRIRQIEWEGMIRREHIFDERFFEEGLMDDPESMRRIYRGLNLTFFMELDDIRDDTYNYTLWKSIRQMGVTVYTTDDDFATIDYPAKVLFAALVDDVRRPNRLYLDLDDAKYVGHWIEKDNGESGLLTYDGYFIPNPDIEFMKYY